jgi:dihydroorotate dehydrogenase
VSYRRLVRPALFRFDADAEDAHARTLGVLARLSRAPAGRRALGALARRVAVPAPRTVFGVDFPNAVGLAAGMDKDGVAVPAWPAMGFGFVEVGTVTRHPQPGNPRPRLYRLPATEGLINRMGFNNAGADVLARRLAALGPPGVPLGVSIGKSEATPLNEAVCDYRYSLRVLHSFADYVAINVSSPNTPGLRGLQDTEGLVALLDGLAAESAELAAATGAKRTPLLVKISPDLADEALRELVDVCLGRGLDGVIATNTTLARPDRYAADEPGGLSGAPLAARAIEVVSLVRHAAGTRLPVIGVGGITHPETALRMLDAGAALVQLYTGLVYSGPGLVRAVNKRLRP